VRDHHRRHYLADAVFTVGVTGPADLIAATADRLARPRWQPYLGRRSCPPDPPLLLRSVDDPFVELTERVPVPRLAHDGFELDFVRETDDAEAAVTELLDVPESFSRWARRYRPRRVSIAPLPVPEALWLGRGRNYRDALFDYAGGAR
jgi:CRISPR system Cascade subunit CasD